MKLEIVFDGIKCRDENPCSRCEMWRFNLNPNGFYYLAIQSVRCNVFRMDDAEYKWFRMNSMDTSLKLNDRGKWTAEKHYWISSVKLHLLLKLKLNWCQCHVCLLHSLNVAIWWQNQWKIQQNTLHLNEQMDNEHTVCALWHCCIVALWATLFINMLNRIWMNVGRFNVHLYAFESLIFTSWHSVDEIIGRHHTIYSFLHQATRYENDSSKNSCLQALDEPNGSNMI